MSYFTNRFDEEVVALLKGGAVGFMPSDTIYGLSCIALNENAVERIHKLKGRDYGKPLIILLASVSQGKILGLNSEDVEPAVKYWPAPLTVEWPAGVSTPDYLHRGIRHFGVRVPNNKKLHDLIKQVGPIASTSANLQGKEPVKSVAEAKEVFGDQLDFYIDGGVQSGQPSTIVKMSGGKLEIVRQGAWRMPL